MCLIALTEGLVSTKQNVSPLEHLTLTFRDLQVLHPARDFL
jgi:hypothetical protein